MYLCWLILDSLLGWAASILLLPPDAIFSSLLPPDKLKAVFAK